MSIKQTVAARDIASLCAMVTRYFIKSAATVRTEECRVAEFGFPGLLPGGSRSTIWMVHSPTFLNQLTLERMSITEIEPLCQDVVSALAEPKSAL